MNNLEQGCAANADVSVEVWRTYLRSRSFIGLFTIMFMGGSIWWVKLLPIIIAQAMIPCLLFLDILPQAKATSFCPGTADPVSKCLAFAIGLIYWSKIFLLGVSKEHEPLIELQPNPNPGRGRFWLKVFMFLDWVANTFFELAVYVVNFALVFYAKSALEMVLNSLALEFVLQLNDVAKKMYISISTNGGSGQPINRVIQKYNETFILTRNTHQEDLSLSVPFLIVIMIVPSFAFVYLPRCKP